MSYRHAFRILEDLGAEADRLGIEVVDVDGKPGPASEFLPKIIRYIEAREAEIDRMQRRLSLWERSAEKTMQMYGGVVRPEYEQALEGAAIQFAGLVRLTDDERDAVDRARQAFRDMDHNDMTMQQLEDYEALCKLLERSK